MEPHKVTPYNHTITRMTTQHEHELLPRPGCDYGNLYEQLYYVYSRKKKIYTLYTDYGIILVIYDDDIFEQDIENGKPIYL